jgi:paraquat-inducible protein B
MHDLQLPITELPRAVPLPARPSVRRRWPSPIWLVPALAAVLGSWLAVRGLTGRGTTVTIRFATAESLEAGKTAIRYKSVDIGLVERIDLLPDRSGVAVTARISPQAEDLLGADARFWVVRPRVSGAGVTGIGTLIGGSYLGFAPGTEARASRDFVGLEHPPFVADRPGRRYLLRSEGLGSLDVGSPVYLRRFKVGQVTRLSLDQQARGVVEVFVEAPYHQHVTTNARFWHASGVDLSVTARGIKLDTQSLAAMLLGGIAFEAPAAAATDTTLGRDAPAAEGREYQLHPTREVALRNPSGLEELYRLTFQQAVRGLAVGAPVDLLGQPVGEVTAVDLQVDRRTTVARTVVTVSVDPRHLRWADGPDERHPAVAGSRAFLDRAVARGLRAQLRTDNPLTGQRYVALELVARAPRAAIDWRQQPAALPTVDGGEQDLVAQMQRTLAGTSRLMARIDGELVPQVGSFLGQANQTLASIQQGLSGAGVVQHEARGAMRDVSNAAQALRSLSEYLERHPESLIRGKRADRK